MFLRGNKLTITGLTPSRRLLHSPEFDGALQHIKSQFVLFPSTKRGHRPAEVVKLDLSRIGLKNENVNLVDTAVKIARQSTRQSTLDEIKEAKAEAHAPPSGEARSYSNPHRRNSRFTVAPRAKKPRACKRESES